MKHLDQFLGWYRKRLVESLSFVFFIHILQLPHMIWNADMYLEMGNISRVNPFLDFILYGVDLLEIPSLINVGLLWFVHMRERFR